MGRLHPQLEIYADDYGLSQGVSAAILAAADQLDAISVMTPLWPERLIALPLKLGLHWAPYTKMTMLIAQRLRAKSAARHLAQSFDQQLDEFTRALGRRPDYVDSHMHVHQVPGVREVFRERLDFHGLKCERSTARFCSPHGGFKRRVLRHYGRAFQAQAPPVLLTLDYKKMQPQEFARWVAGQIAERAEPLQLIVHPGLAADPELKSRDGLWQHRDKDVSLLAELARRL